MSEFRGEYTGVNLGCAILADLEISGDEFRGSGNPASALEDDGDGTSVFMEIRLNSKRTTKEVFEEYATIDQPGFYKTNVPVALAQYCVTLSS